MKKILILGTGNAQVDLAKYCKEHEYEVYGCSYSKGGNAEKYLDHFHLINIVDTDAIEELVKKENIDYVYSVGSDIAMPSVSKVNKNLNLPCFVEYETARLCNTKNDLREHLGSNFEGNVKYQKIEHIDDEIIVPFPCMMKPEDAQGQRGVFKVENEEEFKQYFEKSMEHTRSKRLILEEYIDGPEISVNVFRLDGNTLFSLITDRDTWTNLPGGIIHKHIVPTKISDEEVKNRINDLVERVLDSLNINNGPAYFQIKIKDNKYPKLIEVTPRLDGCHMWNVIKNYCNVDLLNCSMLLLEGKKEEILEQISKFNINGEFILEFMCKEPNKKCNYSDFELGDYIEKTWYYNDGDIVKKMNGYMEKCGYIIKKV